MYHLETMYCLYRRLRALWKGPQVQMPGPNGAKCPKKIGVLCKKKPGWILIECPQDAYTSQVTNTPIRTRIGVFRRLYGVSTRIYARVGVLRRLYRPYKRVSNLFSCSIGSWYATSMQNRIRICWFMAELHKWKPERHRKRLKNQL